MKLKLEVEEIGEIVENYVAAKFNLDPSEVCGNFIDEDGDEVSMEDYTFEIEVTEPSRGIVAPGYNLSASADDIPF